MDSILVPQVKGRRRSQLNCKPPVRSSEEESEKKVSRTISMSGEIRFYR